MSAENVVRRLSDAFRFKLPFETRGQDLVLRPMEDEGVFQFGDVGHGLDVRIITTSGAQVDLDSDGNFDAGRKVNDLAANTTLGPETWNGILTNRGATGAITITLPDDAPVGAWFEYHGVADQDVTFASESATSLIVLNNAAANSLALSTTNEKIGAMARGVFDGTRWHAVAVSGTGTAA
jgi:hypothetical protein